MARHHRAGHHRGNDAMAIMGANAESAPDLGQSAEKLNATQLTGTTISFDSDPYQSVTGTVKVTVGISGTQETTAELITLTIQRGPGPVAVGPTTLTTNGDAAFDGSITWIDTVVPGAVHTWGIQAVAALSSMIVAAGQAYVTIEDLEG